MELHSRYLLPSYDIHLTYVNEVDSSKFDPVDPEPVDVRVLRS